MKMSGIGKLRILAGLGICVVSIPSVTALVALPTNSLSRIFTKEGRPANKEFFPIAVWLQSPANARRFQAAGINLYVGLWNGPTREQLNQLQEARMPVVCEQNRFALENRDNPLFAGWMHGDEPDNAQSLGEGRGYGPPIPPETIIRDYQRIRSADPSRPVLLNLGQGVAWDNWIGRGVRRHHPEDYPEYVKGGDIISFDIYPVVHDSPEVAGKLEFVARGVERLKVWVGDARPVWSCIECTHIGNPAIKATPSQVRSEVWMALVQGARGLIYFVHQFKPAFREAALLDDPEMLAAVSDINRQIRELAPVLNSPTITNRLDVESLNAGVPVAAMVKQHLGGLHVFAVNLRNESTAARFAFRGSSPGEMAEVLGESRTLRIRSGRFEDQFAPYAVHLYRIPREEP